MRFFWRTLAFVEKIIYQISIRFLYNEKPEARSPKLTAIFSLS